jgi:hypothetical protein
MRDSEARHYRVCRPRERSERSPRYVLHVRTPRRLGRVEGAVARVAAAGRKDLEIPFSGKPEEYVRRELNVPLLERR